ncbi:MAG TPA: sigma-54-dependent Fis family transcriptional regulator [Spirochaetes bacterium]|nr:sigma-54-dependent Fis family transcriptional regulator [Spirochaetota bacterium]
MRNAELTLQREKQLKHAWKKFMEEEIIETNIVRPVIADSWKRCRAGELDSYSKNPPNLGPGEVKELINHNQHFIDISRPIMKMIGDMIKGTGFMVYLYDRDGYILKFITDKTMLSKAKELGNVIGGNRAEQNAGTNAIGLALLTGSPIQIVGPEHYNKNLHCLVCSAAPVRDPSGCIIGVINIHGNYKLLHKHTLGTAVGIANAVERALLTDDKINELTTTNKFLNTLIDSISNGLIAINREGNIINVNSIGGKILGLKPESLVDKPVDDVMTADFSLTDVLKSRKVMVDKNVFVKPFGSNEKYQYLVTTRPFDDHEGQLQGAIAVFSEMERVHKLIGGIIGAKARFDFSSIVGNNAKLISAINMAKVASVSSCKILLYGESGTGKEVFAQAIHNNSSRSDKPFIAVNCAAIPRDLVESELFGYDDGAFTGARRGGRPGKFELASDGTLYLDEIDSMSFEAQPKLLRVLETNQVMRVGGSKFIPVNVRIISSAKKDLMTAVREGTFREDLFYRLNMTTIKIVPLRERRDDLPVLIEYFLTKIGSRLGESKIDIGKEVMKVLSDYDWSGNIRELENVIENAILLSQGNAITLDVLPERIRQGSPNSPVNEITSSSLENAEKKMIINVLHESYGNISKASRVLEIDRTTLYRKMKKHMITI